MAHSFLVFDFGGDEEAAQKALRRIEGWKQGFRLDKKMQVRFERRESEAKAAEAPAPAAKESKSGAKGKAKTKQGATSKTGAESAVETKPPAGPSSKVRLIVRLDFSDHEKLSHQRWIERIPTEEPFKTASPKVIRTGEPEFDSTSELFDSLD